VWHVACVSSMVHVLVSLVVCINNMHVHDTVVHFLLFFRHRLTLAIVYSTDLYINILDASLSSHMLSPIT